MDLRPRATKFCPVCLETNIDGEKEWTTWGCGHSIHTTCALQNALHGNITCAVCREVLVDDREDVEDRRDEAFLNVWNTRRKHALQRALRMRGDKRPISLTRALRTYYSAKTRLQKAKLFRASKMQALREAKCQFRNSGIDISLADSVCERLHTAIANLRRAKRHVQDEMLVLDR